MLQGIGRGSVVRGCQQPKAGFGDAKDPGALLVKPGAANIKLSSVATDILGVSGREMIRALIAGQEDPSQLAELARRKLRSKLPELREALRGHLTEHHRFMLRQLMDHLDYLDRQITAFEQRIEELMRPFQAEIERLETIPGVGKRTAQNVLAEIGTDMSRFPTDQHLASWAAMCPGNRESAGKRQSGHTNHGNPWLRAALAQAAWAASHSKGTYLSAQYRRPTGQRRKQWAIVAVGHTMLVMMYHMRKDGVDYREPGPDCLGKLQLGVWRTTCSNGWNPSATRSPSVARAARSSSRSRPCWASRVR